ncbi:uncharacterized protein LOC124447992 [Xenia sp. Carnegie-2017]|uniref:uncharacterized protein LOC124447992 n=1 Tax=Xenia sp. Carnegie-2017 TaxID=2897299 RepID=UPI001F0330CB|nr:uncharacterized protein LOC124447992 [Xenia sp. Carnegie-2017]
MEQFVREEFFVALSSPHISNFNQRHTCRNLLMNTSISSALRRKFYDFKDVNTTTMEKEKKHKILLHLKSVYIGVPIIRLFKRCHQQLEFQKKVFIRDRRISLKAMERKNSNTAGDSAASSEEYCLSHWKKLKTIETKKSSNKTKRMKANRAESPLLRAFKKLDNKKKAKVMKKQEQNVSIMNFVKTSEKQHSEEELNRQSPLVPQVRTRNSSRLTSGKTAAEVEENTKGRKRKKDVFEKETRSKVKNKPQKKQHKEDANEIDANQSKNEVLNQGLCCGNEMESDNFSPLWSELFKPTNSSEIIGNSGAGVRLKKWLTEWKCLREERLNYLKKQEEKNKERLTKKKSKTTRSSIDWSDSDSDFYSSNDQNDAFDTKQICNSMLLSGPFGCGKTSSVYACAEELGFKVIEVNATTKRGGKYILSELLEATQSHQVSTKHDETTGILHVVNSEVETKKDHVTHEENKKDKKKKLKTKSENYFTETQLQGQMSLILLDEVDVLFEEDKGFWLAVNTIRKSSKRPIIMTASDTSAVEIDGEYEHIKLRSPSLAFFAAHLQTVCLAKNVFVNPHDIQALSSLYYPDIRRLLLCLQFWVDSFGGALDKHGIRIMDGSVDGSILSSGISSNNAVGNLHKNSGNVKEEMNNDGLSTPCNDGKTQLSSKDGTSHPIELESSTIPTGSNEGNKSEVNQFSMHKYCLESLLGFGNISTTYENILDCLRPVNKKTFWEKCFLTSHCQSLNLDIVHCNIKHLLPINVSNESSNVNDERKKNELAEDANRTDFQKKMNAISIETLSRFYEDMSFMNAELSTRDDDRKSLWDFQLPSPKISPGLEDSFPSPGKQTWESKNFIYNLRGALEVASLNYNHSYINERRKRFEDKFLKHSVDMPTSVLSSRPDKTEMNCLKNSNGIAIRCYEMSTNGDRHVEVSPCTESILRKSKKQHQIACDVSTYLSEHSFLHWRNTVMDYIPTFQCMCVQECRRREARTKRRFYHYFDSVGLNISSSLIQSLVEENSLT